jgi:GNAT superfamily N-acetyltransferase
MTADLILADRVLAERLERVEAHANAAFVEARAALYPEAGATWRDVDGVWAMFDGVGSPLTQTFGLGVFGDDDDANRSERLVAQLDAIEAFFAERGADVMHEVSVMANPAILPLLAARGYAVVEWSMVLLRPLTAADLVPAHAGTPAVRLARAEEADHWADVAAEGWGETPELAAFMRTLGRVSARAEGTFSFLAALAGEDVGLGALHLHDGVALFAGASTRPDARRQGVQRALFEARLAHAAAAGCDLAMMVAAPGSTSQKNAQRMGFRPTYSRVKWGRLA